MTGTDRRRAVIDEISGCVCRDRQNSYGDAEDNFRNIADLANVVLQQKLAQPLDELDVALFSACIKMARTVGSREYPDNYVDLGGYAVCAAGIIKKWKEDRLGVTPKPVGTIESKTA